MSGKLTYLLYDKYNKYHSYDNPATLHISLDDILNCGFHKLSGNDAITEFNKFGGIYCIPVDLHPELYNVEFYTDGNNKYTAVGVNHVLLAQYMSSNKNIPNYDFLIKLCKYHDLYARVAKYGTIKNAKNNTDIIIDGIISHVKNTVGLISDKMIEPPKFASCNLFPYQKRSINWMLDRERNIQTLSFNINGEILIGDAFYDSLKQCITLNENRTKISFFGGALIDEVGLGKTVQMTYLSLLNKRENKQHIIDDTLHSNATMIICPNHLCIQWLNEIEKMVKIKDYDIKIIVLLTKTHHDRITYRELLNADFVIVSFGFLDNQTYLHEWMHKISPNKSYHGSVLFNKASAQSVFNKLNSYLIAENNYLDKKNPLINIIKWHRLIIDEFHEIYTIHKYNYMANLIPLINSTYRWLATGTPFDRPEVCLTKMLEYVSHTDNNHDVKIFNVSSICDYMKGYFFRHNTKKSVSDEYKLKPLTENIIKLKFSHTERMIYNAYMANPNIDKYSKLLRQLCCHPKLNDETKALLTNCNTLNDVEKMMVVQYEKDMINAQAVVVFIKERIKNNSHKLQYYIMRRQKRLLRRLGYTVAIHKDANGGYKPNESPIIRDNNIISIAGDLEPEYYIKHEEDEKDNDIDDKQVKGKKHIIITDDNQEEINKLISDINTQKSATISELTDYLHKLTIRLDELEKKYDGVKSTYDFYKNVFDKIRKKANSNNPDAEEDNCGICLSEINESEMGITSCGHLYCYQCIKMALAQNNKCPYCRKVLNSKQIFMISYEKNTIKNKKSELIDQVGTKLANIIYYIKNSTENIIIFSQWDDLLKNIGSVLDDYGIKNVFCKGNIWQRNKAIRDFNTNENIKIIMLSSESEASGTNLTKASKIIIVEPIWGTYEYRKNMENQAIGRVYRTGQLNQVEIIRFIIQDSVEETIYNDNIEEDAKYNIRYDTIETKEESITISDDKLIELKKSIDGTKAKKTLKSVKVKTNISIDN